jgi:hypothetical protein
LRAADQQISRSAEQQISMQAAKKMQDGERK